MSYRALQHRIVGAAFLSMVLVGCSAPADTPGTGAESATFTLASSTATPVPPTSTVTPDPSTATPTQIPRVGTDITIELPEGNPQRGQALAENEIKGLDGYSLSCSGCHVGVRRPGPNFAATGELPTIGERAAIRIAVGGYTGAATTPEQYLFESIVLPQAYYVEGAHSEEMPENFGQRLTRQDVADLIAWMLSLE